MCSAQQHSKRETRRGTLHEEWSLVFHVAKDFLPFRDMVSEISRHGFLSTLAIGAALWWDWYSLGFLQQLFSLVTATTLLLALAFYLNTQVCTLTDSNNSSIISNLARTMGLVGLLALWKTGPERLNNTLASIFKGQSFKQLLLLLHSNTKLCSLSKPPNYCTFGLL